MGTQSSGRSPLTNSTALNSPGAAGSARCPTAALWVPPRLLGLWQRGWQCNCRAQWSCWGARAPASYALKRRHLLSPGKGVTHRLPQSLPSWVWLLGIYSPDAQSTQLTWGQEVFAVLAPSLVLPAVTPPHPCQAVLPLPRGAGRAQWGGSGWLRPLQLGVLVIPER